MRMSKLVKLCMVLVQIQAAILLTFGIAQIQLIANEISINCIPAIATLDCPPCAIDADFHSPFIVNDTIDQPHTALLTSGWIYIQACTVEKISIKSSMHKQ